MLYGDSVGGRRTGGSPQRKDFLILFGPFFPGGFLEPPQTQCIKDHTQGGKAGGKGGKRPKGIEIVTINSIDQLPRALFVE